MEEQPPLNMAESNLDFNVLPLKSSEPRKGFKENEQYEEALRSGIRNIDVRTIALAGTYGSGKSSALKSIKRRHVGKRKVRVVSLLDFSELKSENATGLDGKVTQRAVDTVGLQSAIIKQLHSSARRSWIRGSRYNRVERNYSSGVAFFLACWALCGFLFHKQLYDFVLAYVTNILNVGPTPHDAILIGVPSTIFCCMVTAVVISLILYYLLPYTKISEISLFGCSIKISPKEPDFSNSTDEIINILERAKIGVLVFEDLDRFNQPQIYEQLYNLCTTINEYMRNNHPLRYGSYRVTCVFALRDDLLLNAKERTKLFDLYIPVNNPTSPNNAYERVANIFNDYLLVYGPKESDRSACKQFELALAAIAKATTDIRTINAIYNSALTLKRSFIEQGAEWPEDDKIIIAAAMRQLFPEEYALGIEGKGFLDIAHKKCIEERGKKFKKIQGTSYRAEELIAQLEAAIKKDVQGHYRDIDIIELHNIVVSGEEIPCRGNKIKYWRRVIDSGVEKVTFVSISDDDVLFSDDYTISKLKELGPYDALVEAILHSPEVARANDKTKNTEGDAFQLYYTAVKESALEEHITNHKEQEERIRDLAGWVEKLVKDGLVESSYPCYVSPIVRQGESEQLTTFRLYNLARGVTDYTAPVNSDDVDKLVNELNPVEKSSVALLNVHIIQHLLSRNKLELVEEIFEWQVDHIEKLAGFYDMFYALELAILGKSEGPSYHKAYNMLIQITTMLAHKCGEMILYTIANNQSLNPALSLDLASIVLTTKNEPLHLTTGAPSSNDVLNLLGNATSKVIQRGGIDRLVQTFVQYGYTVKDGYVFTRHPDHFNTLIENNLLAPTASNLKLIPAEKHVEYLERNLERIKADDAQTLLEILQHENLSLTDKLIAHFVKILPEEAGIKLVASSDLDDKLFHEVAKNLSERFKQLYCGETTIQFDHQTKDLMKILRRLKGTGVIARYWFDKRTSKLKVAPTKIKAIQGTQS